MVQSATNNESTTNNEIQPPNVKSKRGRKPKSQIVEIDNVVITENEVVKTTIEQNELDVEVKIPKKRGRKPKGGKIVSKLNNTEECINEKPNIILHLKCSMKDLNKELGETSILSYNAFDSTNVLKYDSITTHSNESIVLDKSEEDNNIVFNVDDSYAASDKEDIWKKLKNLEANLHMNNTNNNRSCCFWDTCEFDNPPIYIPTTYINDGYEVYGCFCSPECGVAFLMNQNIDSSTKFERYHLFNHIYSKIYDYNKNIKPAPNPYYMLEKYYGNLTIQEYRSLLQHERLFLVIDKPLTKILPELHEDNDNFILNKKVIPSNSNFQLKSRLNRRNQNKGNILNETFGLTNTAEVS